METYSAKSLFIMNVDLIADLAFTVTTKEVLQLVKQAQIQQKIKKQH